MEGRRGRNGVSFKSYSVMTRVLGFLLPLTPPVRVLIYRMLILWSIMTCRGILTVLNSVLAESIVLVRTKFAIYGTWLLSVLGNQQYLRNCAISWKSRVKRLTDGCLMSSALPLKTRA